MEKFTRWHVSDWMGWGWREVDSGVRGVARRGVVARVRRARMVGWSCMVGWGFGGCGFLGGFGWRFAGSEER